MEKLAHICSAYEITVLEVLQNSDDTKYMIFQL